MKMCLPSPWPLTSFSPLPAFEKELFTNTWTRTVQEIAHDFCFCSGLRGQMPTSFLCFLKKALFYLFLHRQTYNNNSNSKGSGKFERLCAVLDPFVSGKYISLYLFNEPLKQERKKKACEAQILRFLKLAVKILHSPV